MNSSHTESPRQAGLCRANGADLYHELRGSGPTLLMIAGATGDGGSFDAVATGLATRFTVLTYDRRAHSRSPRPAGWLRTSVDEQADDAAGLLQALSLAPAYVYGNSSGATIAMNLALRHPRLVLGAVLHEPPKIGVLPDRDAMLAALRQRMDRARAIGGGRGAMADFLGWLSGDGRGAADEARMQRVLDNGDVWLDQELGIVDRYDPPAALLERRSVPTAVAVGSVGGTELHQRLLDAYAQALAALAASLGGRLHRMSGAHVPFRTHPQQFVAELEAIVDSLQG